MPGKLIAVVYRYDPPGRKKEFRPWDAKRRKMAPPDPRPLYNQPGHGCGAHVVLVEGEKCAQALIDIGIWPPRRCTARMRRSTRPTGRRWRARPC
jgi:putative DNA primase/helicase